MSLGLRRVNLWKQNPWEMPNVFIYPIRSELVIVYVFMCMCVRVRERPVRDDELCQTNRLANKDVKYYIKLNNYDSHRSFKSCISLHSILKIQYA